jgi:DNA-binding transcriptional MerR regulator
MTVHEAAGLAGVSARTLRWYDRLGLLPPAAASEAGYRLYDEAALRRLQQILFLKELDFPLGEIGPMLAMETGDRQTAVRRHRDLLRMKAERLNGLIGLCDRLLEGEDTMDLQAFQNDAWETGRDEYAREAKERWGDTDAWRESEKRTAAYGKEEQSAVKAEGEAILRKFAALAGQDPASPAVRAALAEWRAYIGARFYPVTEEILSGLGQMYAGDGRFTRALDAYGEGTARLMSEAIRRRNE